MAFIVRVEGGKYAIVQNDEGELRVDRGEIRGWLLRPAGGKMLIALAGEVESARRLLRDLKDVLVEDGMRPDFVARVEKYMQIYQVEEEDCRKGEI